MEINNKGKGENFSNLTKNIHNNTITSSKYNNKMLKTCPLSSRTKQDQDQYHNESYTGAIGQKLK